MTENCQDEPVKQSVNPCLHCALVDTINAWSRAHRDGAILPRLALTSLARCISEILQDAPVDDRHTVTAGVCAMIAEQAGILASFEFVEPDDVDRPAPGDTQH